MDDIINNQFEKYCINGNYEKIDEFLKKYNWLVNWNDGQFFEIVANNGRLDLIKLFIKNGADIHANNDCVLYTCSYHNYIDCIEYLIKNGADAEINKNFYGCENLKNYHDNT